MTSDHRDREGFEQARRAKVVSVDPACSARNDIDGHDRPRIFELLRSFDHLGLTPAEFGRRTLGLLDLPGKSSPSAADVLEHYLEYFPRVSLESPDSPESGGSASKASLAVANELLGGQFRCRGRLLHLPDPIDWDRPIGDDHFPCELNRFGFLWPLVGAFHATGDRRYAHRAVTLILQWVTATDICDSFIPGPDPDVWQLSTKSRFVWLSHLEPAIHLGVWGGVLARLLTRAPDLIDPADFLRILKSVHDQLQWLDLIVPEGGHGNGLITGHGGQLQAMAWFPTFRDAPRLARRAMQRIEASLAIQVLPDGVQHELTPHYHFCCTKDLLNILEAGRYLPVQAPASLRGKVTAMLRYVRATLTPDGKQVAFNDGDAELGGWTLAHLGRPIARELLGPDADAPMHSACYPWAGVMILRQGSEAGRDELYLAFDGGPFGNVHQHEDALSFWLSAYGRSFIVDPGRHLYDFSAASYYPYLQTTRAHSTIRIDDRDQNSRACPDRWVSREPLPLTWHVEPDGRATAGAAYDLGYGPDQVAVTHARKIQFFPRPGYWILEDTMTGADVHDVESRFQFAPGDLLVEAGMACTAHADANLAVIWTPADWDSVTVEKGQTDPRAGWYSGRWGQIEPAPALVLRARGRRLPMVTRLTLVPYRGAVMPAHFSPA